MIDDDDDDDKGSLLAFGLAPCKKICEKQHWDDVSHARVSPASLLVVGDYKLTAYRSAMGKPPLLPMAAGRDSCRLTGRRTAPYGLPVRSHGGQTGPGEGRKTNSP